MADFWGACRTQGEELNPVSGVPKPTATVGAEPDRTAAEGTGGSTVWGTRRGRFRDRTVGPSVRRNGGLVQTHGRDSSHLTLAPEIRLPSAHYAGFAASILIVVLDREPCSCDERAGSPTAWHLEVQAVRATSSAG